MNAPQAHRLPRGLYAVCDDTVAPQVPLAEKARRLVDGGVRVLQLRMKRTPERAAVDAARRISELCRERRCLCLVNDRVDWALAAGADGAHVGDQDLPAGEARAALGPGRVLGVTVRNAAGAASAAALGADYVGAGPVFASTTKSLPVPLLGLEGLRRLCAESPAPVVAISGIGVGNIASVAAAGAHGAAVVSDLLLAPDVARRARELAGAFEKGVEARTLGGA